MTIIFLLARLRVEIHRVIFCLITEIITQVLKSYGKLPLVASKESPQDNGGAV
jgi:hypothetical protein